MTFAELKIAVIGLGYVGLPLAVEFGKKYQTNDTEPLKANNKLNSSQNQELASDFLGGKKSKSSINTFFYPNHRLFFCMPSLANDKKILIGIIKLMGRLLNAPVIFPGGFFTDASAFTALGKIQETGAAGFVNSVQLLAEMIFVVDVV